MDTDFWLSTLDYFYICAPFPVTSLLWVLWSCPRGLQLSEILIQLPLLANFMENRLVLADILAVKNNDLHILNVGEKVITLHLEEFVLTEFGRPVTVPVTVIVLKVTVLNLQSWECSVWSCPLCIQYGFVDSVCYCTCCSLSQSQVVLMDWTCGMDCWVIPFLIFVCF